MIAKSINKIEIKDKNFSFKKNNKKYKTFAKSIFFLSAFIFSGTFTNFVKDNYDRSKEIDTYEAYYHNLKSYDDFKASMDTVPYTDEMFNQDLSTFKKIYGNKDTRSVVGYNDYHFVYARTMLNNDPQKVDKYISYFKGYDEKSYYKDKVFLKQYDYVKSLYKNETNRKLTSITVNKTISTALSSRSIIENRQHYLEENNIYKYTYGLTSEESHKYYNLTQEEKRIFNENQKKEFYEFVDTASNNDLRKMFKAINSYQFLVAQHHFGLQNILDNQSKFISPEYISSIYYKNIPVFDFIELMRNKDTSNEEAMSDRYSSIY